MVGGSSPLVAGRVPCLVGGDGDGERDGCGGRGGERPDRDVGCFDFIMLNGSFVLKDRRVHWSTP